MLEHKRFWAPSHISCFNLDTKLVGVKDTFWLTQRHSEDIKYMKKNVFASDTFKCSSW